MLKAMEEIRICRFRTFFLSYYLLSKCTSCLVLLYLCPSNNCFMFQGVAMPAMNNMISKWIPVSERSRALSFVYSGMYLGSVTGLAFSPFLIHKFGWPSVFYSFGSLGSIWFALWIAKVSALFS